MRKLKFYLIGFIPGLIFVFFVLNQKGASCSGYLPNSRVIAESVSKKIEYTDQVKQKISQYQLSESLIKEKIIKTGKINFDRSNAQKLPCPEYFLESNEYDIFYQKCKENILIFDILKK